MESLIEYLILLKCIKRICNLMNGQTYPYGQIAIECILFLLV